MGSGQCHPDLLGRQTGRSLLHQGYFTDEAQILAVESRTSSPLRIPRDKETFMHTEVEGLFPSGEGAGYAGGIVSAAIDGERCAEASWNYISNK